MHADFEYYGSAFGLSTVCVYGGAPYGPQQNAMRRGVDVVVGTPGRVKVIFCLTICLYEDQELCINYLSENCSFFQRIT